MDQISDVIIIGSGPAGLSAAAALKKKNVTPLVLEEKKQAGDSWRRHYDCLELNSIKQLSNLPFTKMSKSYPRYPTRDQMVEYFTGYEKTHDIAPKYGVKVKSIEKSESAWKIISDTEEYRARNVVIATGLNRTPKRITIEGMNEYNGEIIHSSEYKTGKNYSGKKVLVVGGGSSASDIAKDLVEHNAQVDLSLRGPIHVTPLELLGVPAQVTSILLAKLPLGIADRLANTALGLRYGDLNKYGISKPKVGPISQIVKQQKVPLFDRGVITLIKKNRIKVYPSISRLTENKAVFSNNRENEYDLIVLATGYTTGLEEILPKERNLIDESGKPEQTACDVGGGLYFLGFKDSPRGLLYEINQEALKIVETIGKSN